MRDALEGSNITSKSGFRRASGFEMEYNEKALRLSKKVTMLVIISRAIVFSEISGIEIVEAFNSKAVSSSG